LSTFGCEYAQTYGLTETSPFLTLSLLQAHHHHLSLDKQLATRSRTGRPYETIDLEIVDDQDQPVPQNDRAVGEIRVRGTTVSPGYWQRPQATAEAFRGGWFYTGDLATWNKERSVNIVDRAKDVILTGGENVYSTEVEAALLEHRAVLECAAFGVPHPEWGEELRIAVLLRPGDSASEDELRDHCRERLANYKVPKRVELMDELPRTGSGKVQKRVLRERANS
jgi:acyl-CoA synthetase (AMP-forming)/AMP-acid ligase II